VWFHFGAFQFGSGSNPMHDGSLFAAQGVVVVTVNYRLGRFGFLAHPDLSAESENQTSGNYGLLDQIAALEWVQRNIKSFGGDPTSVTIGGASSGGASVHLLRVSPLAKGLFTKAICESGPGVAPAVDGLGHVAAYTTLSAAEQTGAELLDIIGVSSIEELRQLPADQILMPQLPRIQGAWKTALWPFSTSLSVFDAATPIIDGHVVPESPLSALMAGRSADVPTLAGNVTHEACGLPGLSSLIDYKSYLKDTFGERADEVFDIYPAANDTEVNSASSELLADQCFVWSTWASARLQARNLTSPMWYYRHDRAPPIPSDSEIIEKDGAGAFHVCGSLYAFGNLDARDWDWTEADRELSKDIQQAWVHFIKTGNPNSGNTQGFGSWPALKPDDESVRIWDVESGLEGPDLRLAGITAFWDSWYGLEQN
jgi:para-nitrobenzyl esterase